MREYIKKTTVSCPSCNKCKMYLALDNSDRIFYCNRCSFQCDLIVTKHGHVISCKINKRPDPIEALTEMYDDTVEKVFKNRVEAYAFSTALISELP